MHETATAYSHWLSRRFAPLIDVEPSENGDFTIRFCPTDTPLIKLSHSSISSRSDRATFEITEGLLVRPTPGFHGRLEFREVSSARTMIAALHDFTPRLPWFIYRFTQALMHLWVMRSFSRYLTTAEQSP